MEFGIRVMPAPLCRLHFTLPGVGARGRTTQNLSVEASAEVPSPKPPDAELSGKQAFLTPADTEKAESRGPNLPTVSKKQVQKRP